MDLLSGTAPTLSSAEVQEVPGLVPNQSIAGIGDPFVWSTADPTLLLLQEAIQSNENVPKVCWSLPELHRVTPIHTDPHGSTRVYTELHGSTKIYMDLDESTRIYAELKNLPESF